MRLPIRAVACPFVFVAFTVALAMPARALAQTTPVADPTTLVFTPSADHDAVLADGRPAVDHYTFDVYSVGAAQPFQSTNIGKPAPASDGSIYYNFSSMVASWPLPGGTYESRVSAVGPNGSGVSAPSNSFTFSSCAFSLSPTSASLPAAGGGTQVSVVTSSGCGWTASSDAAWIALSAASGTGSATIVATVAANASTAARVGTITVAGQAFTVSQAGAACAFSLSSPAQSFPASGGSGSVGVTTTSGCGWTATSGASWVTVSPASGSSSGTVSYTVAPNSGAARSATLTIAGSAYTVSQSAAVATPAPTSLPSPWQSQDVGAVGLAGSATFSSGVFSVAGSGSDIGGSADAFQFVYQSAGASSTIVARVTGQQNVNASAKAGVMIRSGPSANAASATLDVRPDGSVEFIVRSRAGGTSTITQAAAQPAPAWVRLVRSSKTVTASVSADGSTWRTVGSARVFLGSAPLTGLAVTSHDTAQSGTATFENVSVR